ncbi:MFS transporter [Mesorhizobium sp. M8A.F.Ca.ET.057.01.1.1]|uniref:MFS transporter n=1 Tax=Mesorhizobium sp. M8A.F.Ca.ET.057.01.1.1 TaxID=2493679 RepID=UPI001AED001D|nr:MFS transporter [Mesorhizobium sp. M8A.F.Ca.ET.057.01.1.1]
MSNALQIHANLRSGLQSRLWLGFLASTLSAAVGRNGYYIASAWTVVTAGYGGPGVPALLATVSVVELVASPLAGLAADRFDRRRLNIATDLGRFAILLTTACSVLYLEPFLTLCVSAALFSICYRVALTASQAMIPLMTRGAELATTNSTVFFTMQFGSLGAALLAGSLLGGRSPALTFLVLALLFLVSAGSLCWMRPGLPRKVSERPQAWHRTWTGISFVCLPPMPFSMEARCWSR